MDVLMPASFDAALALKAEHPDAVPLAGGTDLLVEWPSHPGRHDQLFLDLSALTDCRPMQWSSDSLELGALTTYWDVLSDARAGDLFPLLHAAGSQVGAVQIQSRGTWAGNIANASPAADGVPVLMAYDAEVILASAGGERVVPLAEFYGGYKAMDLQPDELIRSIRLPLEPSAFAMFEKVGPRRAQAITKVGVAVVRQPSGWRVVANSVAPTVCRCPALEALLDERRPVSRPEDLLDAINQDVTPIDDVRSTAAYRLDVLSRVLYHGLAGECEWWS